MGWKAEHGGDFEVPGVVEFLVKKGILEDQSWHNDASPSFAVADPKREEYGVRLWVDHPITSMRENLGKRFVVTEGEFGTESDFELETDDLEEALLETLKRLKKYIPDKIDDDPEYMLTELLEEWAKSERKR